MDIEREWAKEPGWFDAQEPETRARLIAHWEVRHCPPEPKGGSKSLWQSGPQQPKVKPSPARANPKGRR
jgi:hypothetical protein